MRLQTTALYDEEGSTALGAALLLMHSSGGRDKWRGVQLLRGQSAHRVSPRGRHPRVQHQERVGGSNGAQQTSEWYYELSVIIRSEGFSAGYMGQVSIVVYMLLGNSVSQLMGKTSGVHAQVFGLLAREHAHKPCRDECCCRDSAAPEGRGRTSQSLRVRGGGASVLVLKNGATGRADTGERKAGLCEHVDGAETICRGCHRGQNAARRHRVQRRRVFRQIRSVSKEESRSAAPATQGNETAGDAFDECSVTQSLNVLLSELPANLRVAAQTYDSEVGAMVTRAEWRFQREEPSPDVSMMQALTIYDVKGCRVAAQLAYERETEQMACTETGELPAIREQAAAAFEAAWRWSAAGKGQWRVRDERALTALGSFAVSPSNAASRLWDAQKAVQEVELCESCDDEGAEPASNRQGAAARQIQRSWRAHSAEAGLAWWDVKRSRRIGSLVSHVLFLQHLFRKARERWPEAWARGGRRGTGRVWERPTYRCQGGKNLAGAEEFEAHIL